MLSPTKSYLPVTKTWLKQLILALILICHCSYRGVKELLRDLFDTQISLGSIHNLVHSTAIIAQQINQKQDLSSVQVGLHDEIFQGSQPVWSGVDAMSTNLLSFNGRRASLRKILGAFIS